MQVPGCAPKHPNQSASRALPRGVPLLQGNTCPAGKLSVRLEVYRLAKESAWGWWATYDYVANDEPCQEVQPSEGQRGRRQVMVLQAGAGGGEPRALPARGKIVVMTEGRLPMEAGFMLPASESKCVCGWVGGQRGRRALTLLALFWNSSPSWGRPAGTPLPWSQCSG